MTVQDAKGKTVTSFSGTIKVAPYGAGGEEAQAMNGVAKFSGLYMTIAGYLRLTAWAPQIQGSEAYDGHNNGEYSNEITVSSGPPAGIRLMLWGGPSVCAGDYLSIDAYVLCI